MCCLFGIIDYRHSLTKKQQSCILSTLSVECEVRGTDATGIAYNYNDNLCIYKRAFPAHRMRFRIPKGVYTVMGHTRMTTQGNERHNYNNHPFYGNADGNSFALAHNGILYNDTSLRKQERLPKTKIETDSFVAVQLIEKRRRLDFDSLRYMAEQIKGTFTITVLDSDNNMHFVKGDNPICIYHYKKSGIYIYASTEEILVSALSKVPYDLGDPVKVEMFCGDILKIDKYGIQSHGRFNTEKLLYHSYYPYSFQYRSGADEYMRDLKSTAASYGLSPEYIDYLIDDGFTTDDIEELIYCGGF